MQNKKHNDVAKNMFGVEASFSGSVSERENQHYILIPISGRASVHTPSRELRLDWSITVGTNNGASPIKHGWHATASLLI